MMSVALWKVVAVFTMEEELAFVSLGKILLQVILRCFILLAIW